MEEVKQITDDAIADWKYFVDKCDKACAQLMIADTFDNLSVYDLQTKLNSLQKSMDSMVEKDLQVHKLKAQAETIAQHEETIARCEVWISKMLARIAELNKEKRDQARNPKRAIAAEVHEEPQGNQSPQINNTWGRFSGEVYEWQRFSKRFKSDVHENASLTDEQKYELLRDSCFGNAQDIIADAGPVYAEAWKRLMNLFGDAYTTVSYAIHKIHTMLVIDRPDYDAIKRLQTYGRKCVEAMQSVDLEAKFDPFLVVMLSAKLDRYTAVAWDRYRTFLAKTWVEAVAQGEPQKDAALFIPPWTEFSKFLDEECEVHRKQAVRQSYCDNNGIAPSTTSRVSTGTNAGTSGAQNNLPPPVQLPKPSVMEKMKAPIDLQCTMCDYVHMPYRCEVFRAMSLNERWSAVEAHGLCPRCLRKYHGNYFCINKANNEKCMRCYKHHGKTVYHNSSLCSVAAGDPTEQPRSAPIPEEDWEDSQSGGQQQ